MANTIINNRVIQNQIKPYKTKSEISEALFMLREYVSVSTYKWLSHFKYTDHGITQAKIVTICELSDVPESTFYKIVKPEIEKLFGEPLIKKLVAPRKMDHSRTKKVRASEFKVLQPLNKIKYLINQFVQAEKRSLQAFTEELFFIPGVEYPVEYTVESNPEIPCQTSSDDDEISKQNKSIRENHLEKHNNIFNSPQNIPNTASRKIKIKTEIKNYLENFPVFRDFTTWSEFKRYEIARTIQLAVIKTKTDIQEKKSQFMIKNAIARLMAEYQDKPLNEFLRLLYTFVFNALKDDQEETPEHSEDDAEEIPSKKSKQARFWDKMKPTLRRLLDEKPKDDRSQEEKVAEIEEMLRKLDEPASKRELDDLGVY